MLRLCRISAIGWDAVISLVKHLRPIRRDSQPVLRCFSLESFGHLIAVGKKVIDSVFALSDVELGMEVPCSCDRLSDQGFVSLFVQPEPRSTSEFVNGLELKPRVDVQQRRIGERPIFPANCHAAVLVRRWEKLKY